MSSTLLVAAHGTRSAAGVATVRRLVRMVGDERPALSVELGFLDVCAPGLAQVLAALSGPAVVVPLLLASGYHVHTDIPGVVAERPARVARPVGPDRALIDVLARRLAAAGGSNADLVVLAASPSRHPSAVADVQQVAADLEAQLGRPVLPRPIRPEFAADLRELASDGRSLAVSSYLLAEGEFANQARRAAASGVPVAEPLGADAVVADIVLRRYDEVTRDN